MQLPPMGHTVLVWHACVQLPYVETQTPPEQMVLSAQSAFCVQPAAQRGCAAFVAVSQPCPSGQSEAVTQPAAQLFEPSGFCWQTWPLLQSASREQTLRLKQALARHW